MVNAYNGAMAKANYTVAIVRKELLSLWHDFWDGPQSPAAKKANKHGALGQTVMIRARNKNEAADLAEQQNPGYVAIRDATERHP